VVWTQNGIRNQERPTVRDIELFSPEAVDIIKTCLAREYAIYNYALEKFNRLNLDPVFLLYESQWLKAHDQFVVKDCYLKFKGARPVSVCN